MTRYTYSIINDTLNSKVNLTDLQTEINGSNIVETLQTLSTEEDILAVEFNDTLSEADEATLVALISSHEGLPTSEEITPQEVKIVEEVASAPFASKQLATGQKLFKRVHGLFETIPANSAGTVRFTVPYMQAKINALEIIGASLGDHANFNVYDNAEGTISTIPSFKLNQFGFNVCMRPEFHKEESQYDADVIQGMVLELEFTNNTNSPSLIGANFILHELV